MTITNLGYGGVTGGSYQALSTLVGEFAANRFESTINNESPILGSKALQQVDTNGEELVVYVTVGGFHATAWVQDFARLPEGGSFTPTKGRAVPSNVVSVMKMGRAADLAKLGDEGMSSLFDATLQLIAEDAARHVGRGLYGGSIAPQAGTTWDTTAANGVATVNFLDVSIFKPGAAYDYIDASLSLAYVVRCTGVTPAAVGANSENVAGSVSFINDVVNPATGSVTALGDTAIATGDSFQLRGTTAGFGGSSTAITGNALTSYADITSTSSTLMGIAPASVAGWVGSQRDLSAAYSQEAALAFAMRIRQTSGQYFTHVFTSPQIAAAHASSSGIQGSGFGFATGITAARPSPVDKSMDKYAGMENYWDTGLRLGGKPVIADPNCPATQLIFHNSDKCKLAVWKKLGPDNEAGDPIFVDRDRFTVSAQFSGSMQLYTSDRNAIGRMFNVTGL